MTKLVVAFNNYENAPCNELCIKLGSFHGCGNEMCDLAFSLADVNKGLGNQNVFYTL